jgi:hypothetical protein
VQSPLKEIPESLVDGLFGATGQKLYPQRFVFRFDGAKSEGSTVFELNRCDVFLRVRSQGQVGIRLDILPDRFMQKR